MNNEIERRFLKKACLVGVISKMSPINEGPIFSSIVIARRIFCSASSKIICIVAYDKKLSFLLFRWGVKRHRNVLQR